MVGRGKVEKVGEVREREREKVEEEYKGIERGREVSGASKV